MYFDLISALLYKLCPLYMLYIQPCRISSCSPARSVMLHPLHLRVLNILFKFSLKFKLHHSQLERERNEDQKKLDHWIIGERGLSI